MEDINAVRENIKLELNDLKEQIALNNDKMNDIMFYRKNDRIDELFDIFLDTQKLKHRFTFKMCVYDLISTYNYRWN